MDILFIKHYKQNIFVHILKVIYTYTHMYGTKRKICTKDSDLFWRRENIRRKIH